MPQCSSVQYQRSLFASLLAMLLLALVPQATVQAGDLLIPDTTNTTPTEQHPASKAFKSQSSQNLGGGERHKIAVPPPPSGEDTEPTQMMISKGLRGKASFYSSRFQGRKTATGDRFNNKLFTAASNLFPLGSLVAVKRPDSNLCVIVKINDRMHAKHRVRIIDLSSGAAKYLDMMRDGVIKVQVTKLPLGASEGTIECTMGYEIEEDCADCTDEKTPL